MNLVLWLVPPLRRGWLRVSSFQFQNGLLAVKKRETRYPSSKTNAPPSRITSLNGIAYSTCFTPPPSQGIVGWEQRLTAFYSALYTFFFSLLVPCGVNVLTTYLRKFLHLFCSLCGKRRSQFRKTLAIVLPKKKGGKKRWWKWNDAGHLR